MDLTTLDAYLEKQTLDFYYNNLNNSKGFLGGFNKFNK